MQKSNVTSWITQLSKGSGPRYIQIADLIEKSIQSGILYANSALPSQRWLAAELGVDLTTVTRAYAEARNRGLIASFSGRGSYVVGAHGSAHDTRVDLAMNTPPPPADASLSAHLQAGMQHVLTHRPMDSLSRYAGGAASQSAIQAAQTWLQPALGEMKPGRLALGEGAQAALFAILLANVRQGEAVLCEALTYPGLLQAAHQLGLHVIGLESDEDGVLPDAIEREQRRSGARLLYLNPTLHNPTARTMPEHRRQDIARTLQGLPLTLVEDDPYRYLLNAPPPPIAALNGGRNTYYLASLSKCLSPALRTAFIVPPRGDDGSVLQAALHAASLGGSALLIALTEHWIRTGMARQLVQQIQREARARQKLARSLLPEQAYAHPTGIHVWLPLPRHWNQQLFAHTLDAAGISVACADTFSTCTPTADAVRISLGGASDHATLARSLRAISELVQQTPRRMNHAIV